MGEMGEEAFAAWLRKSTRPRIVDLNTAPEEELADLPMVGPKRARELMRHRPFKSWDDVQNVPGFDGGMIDDLKSGGARIGS